MKLQIKQGIKNIGRCVWNIYWRRQMRKFYRHHVSAIQPEQLTIYPEKKRKETSRIKSEILELLLSEKGGWTPEATIQEYFFFGCDCEDNNVSDYVFSKEYSIRQQLNGRFASLLDYKNVAAVYLNARGIRASCALGEVDQQGVITLMDGSSLPFLEWFNSYGHSVFCKPNDGNQGRGCCRVDADSSACGGVLVNGVPVSEDELKKNLAGKIVEPFIVQHHLLREYSPNCVNPLRIRTVYFEGKFELISIYICFGGAEAFWSNGISSGIMVALDQDGHGISDGFCEVPGKVGRYQTLPGTQSAIREIVVPGVREAVELALAAHRTLPRIYTIGWDVAVTEDGPIIIEGNADYGPVTYQSVTGKGERSLFEKYFSSQL